MKNEQCPEVFVDELAGIMLGYAITKLTFVTVRQVGADGSVEKTKALTLSMPTLGLINTCKSVLDHAKANQALMSSGASESTEKLLVLLEGDAVDTAAETAAVVKKKTKVVK